MRPLESWNSSKIANKIKIPGNMKNPASTIHNAAVAAKLY